MTQVPYRGTKRPTPDRAMSCFYSAEKRSPKSPHSGQRSRGSPDSPFPYCSIGLETKANSSHLPALRGSQGGRAGGGAQSRAKENESPGLYEAVPSKK